MTAVFAILSVQALAGAFDNLWHHELEARLPQRISARYELLLHAAREAIYGVLFLGLAWLRWQGAWAWVLAALLAAELVITLVDFIEEDLTRRLPPLERVLHTGLAISYGAFCAALAPVLAGWAALPTGLVPEAHGGWSALFTLYAAGVLAWSVRNFAAASALHRRARTALPADAPRHPPAGSAVLVTGGTGFIGTALVEGLVAEGRRVIVLTRDARRAEALFGPRVQAVESLDRLPAETRIDAVVNLAGAPIMGGPWTAARKKLLTESRVRTTAAVIDLIERLETRPRVLISASAVGYYGIPGDAGTLEERAPAQPGCFQSDLCAAWEREARRAERLGVRTVRLRLGLVLGKGGGVLPPLLIAARLGLGAVLGTGRQPFPWIHLDDTLGLIRYAIDHDELRGAVNAVAPGLLDQRGFTKALAARHGRAVRLRIPAAPLCLLLGEMSELLLHGQRAVPRAALAAGYRFQHPLLRGTATKPGKAAKALHAFGTGAVGRP